MFEIRDVSLQWIGVSKLPLLCVACDGLVSCSQCPLPCAWWHYSFLGCNLKLLKFGWDVCNNVMRPEWPGCNRTGHPVSGLLEVLQVWGAQPSPASALPALLDSAWSLAARVGRRRCRPQGPASEAPCGWRRGGAGRPRWQVADFAPKCRTQGGGGSVWAPGELLAALHLERQCRKQPGGAPRAGALQQPGGLSAVQLPGALRHLPEPPQERLHRSRPHRPSHVLLHLR